MSNNLANPGPLGLMGFGMTTILINISNAGFFPIDSMILAIGIFYGGMAQLIAGLMCYKKDDTFGMTAFCSYGLYWIILVTLIVMPNMGFPVSPPHFMAWFFSMWAIFTGLMFIGTLRHPFALQVVFGSAATLFALLAITNFTGSEAFLRIAGWEGIFCGASAFYFAIAQVLNGEYGRIVLPTGEKSEALISQGVVA